MSNLAALISDGTAVAGIATSTAGAPCRLAEILAGLDDHDLAVFKHALHTPPRKGGRSDEFLAAALDRDGKPVAESTVRRHRLGVCACRNTATTRNETDQ